MNENLSSSLCAVAVPVDSEEFTELGEKLVAEGRWDELLQAYSKSVQAYPDLDSTSAAFGIMGDIALTKLSDPAKAEAFYRQALIGHPDDQRALSGLTKALQAVENFDEEAIVLERRARVTRDGEDAALFAQAGQAFLKVGRRDRAVIALTDALKRSPNQPEVAQTLFGLLMDLGRFQSAADVLETIRTSPSSDGFVTFGKAFVAATMNLPSLRQMAKKVLDALIQADPNDGETTQLKENFHALDSAEGIQARIEMLSAAAFQGTDRKAQALACLALAQMIRLSGAENGIEEAREKIAQALSLWPGMPQAFEALEELAVADGDWASLVAFLEKLASQTEDRSARMILTKRLATVKIVRLQDDVSAMEDLTKVCEECPGNLELTTMAAELLIEHARFQEASDLLAFQARTTESRDRQEALLLKLADLHQRQLQNPMGAAGWYEQVLSLSLSNRSALSALEKIYETEGEPERLLRVQEKILKTLGSQDEKFQLLLKMADLEAELLEREDLSLSLKCRALVIHPTDLDLADEIAASAEKFGNEALESVADAMLRASKVAPPQVAKELLRRVARIFSGPLARTQVALGLWKSLLAKDSSDEEARVATADILDRLAAAGNIDQVLASGGSDEERAALVRQEIARFEAEKDEGARPSQDTMWALYSKLPELGELTSSEVGRMMDLARSQGRWEDLARLCERAVASEKEASKRADLKFAWASVLSGKLGRAEDACLALLSAVKDEGVTPRLADALRTFADEGIRREAVAEALLPAFRSSNDVESVAWALTALSLATRDTSTKLDLYLELAGLYEGTEGNSRKALSWLEKAIRIYPSNGDIRSRAEKLAEKSGAQSELASLYLEVARGEDGAMSSRALLLSSADLAAAACEYDLAIQALDMVLAKGADREAFDRLHACARKAGRPAERVRALQGILALSLAQDTGADGTIQEDSSAADARVELCELFEGMGRFGEAQRLLEEHVEKLKKPTADVLFWLEKLCLEAGDRAGAQRALSLEIELAEQEGNSEDAPALRLRLSKLIEEAGDADGAIAQYAKVLAAKPDDVEALSALERMYDDPERKAAAAQLVDVACQAAHDHERMVRAVEILESVASNTAEKIQYLRRQARIYASDLHMPEMGFAALAKAIPLAPGDVQIRVAARRLAEGADALDSYVEVLDEALANVTGAESISLLREMADIYERKLGDHDCALDCLRRVRKLDPEDVDALKGLHDLYRRLEMPEELADVSMALGQTVLDDQVRRRFWRQAGKLYEEKLSDLQLSAKAWRALAESDPLDREAAQALDRLYSALNLPNDLAFALELRRAQESDSVEGREVTYRLAMLKKDVLGDPKGALELFQKVLQGNPSHPETLDALENWVRTSPKGALDALAVLDPVLAQSGEHSLRVELRDIALENAPMGMKNRIASEIRSICEVSLADPDRAFMAACRHFSDGIDRENALPEMDRLARLTDNAEVFADVCEGVLASSGLGDELKLRLLRRTAAIRESLGDTDASIALYRKILEEIPSDRAAFAALDRLLVGSGDASALAEAYLGQLAQETDSDARKRLQMKAAQALFDAGRLEEAIDNARAVLVSDPGSAVALSLLERAHGKLGQWREQTDVLRQLCEVLPSQPERERAALSRAQLLEENGEPAEAIDAYEHLLKTNPGDQRAVGALENLFSKERTRPLAARVLEEHYRSTADVRRLCDVLEVKASFASRQERLDLLGELAHLREKMGEKSTAFATLLRVLSESDPEEVLLSSLERLASELGTFEELAAAYEDALDRHPSESVALKLRTCLAAIYDERLGDNGAASTIYEALAEATHDDPKILDDLIRIYRRGGMDDALVSALWRRAAKETEPSKKQKLLVEVASVCESRLSDLDQAIRALKEVQIIAPFEPQTVSALTRLLEATERYPELAELTEKCIDLAEEQGRQEQSLELRIKLGQIRRDKMSDPRVALSIFTTVLYKRPGHPGAVAELEKMAEAEGPLRGEAALALQPVFENAGDDAKLVQMLEARAQTSSPQERASLFRRIAQVYEGALDDVDMAFIYAGRALEASPDDLEILADARRMADQAGTKEELAGLLDELIPSAKSDDARIAMLRILAAIQQGDGSEDEEAIGSYRRILELIPGDKEALDALETLYRRNELWADVCEVLRSKLAFSTDLQESVELRRALATVQLDELKDVDGAVASLRQLLAASPEDASALNRLEVIFEGTSRQAELADVLAQETALCAKNGENEKALELKLRHAVLRSEKLLDRDGALTLFSEFLSEKPGHLEATNSLARLVERDFAFEPAGDLLAQAYSASGQKQQLAELLEERASVTEGPRKLEFFLESAQLRIQFGRADLAFISLCRAHREDPTHREVRDLLNQTSEQAEALEELAELYAETLVRLDGDDALDVSLSLGGLYEKLRDPERAAAAYERAREIEQAPSCRALKALLRIYSATNDAENTLSVLKSLAESESDASIRAAHFFEMGELCLNQLDPPSPDRAAQAYEQALALDASHLKASRALADLYESARMFERLMEILEAQRTLVSGNDLLSLLGRMAQVAEEGMNDPKMAMSLYEELRGHSPRSPLAFGALERLYESSGRDDDLVALLQDRISGTVDPRELLRLYDKKGRVLVRLERDDEAIVAFQSALDRDPRSLSTLEALRDVREKAGPSEELAGVLRRLIPLQGDLTGVKAVRLRFAEVLAQIGKRTEALDAARRVFDMEPHTVEEMRRVGDLFMNLDSPADQVRALEQEAMVYVEDDEEEKALEIFNDIARVQAEQLNKPLAAASSYERILDIDPRARGAFEKIKEIYVSLKEWRKLADVHERFIAAIEDPAERIALQKDLVGIQECKLGQKDVAFITACRAFSELPEDEDIRVIAHRLAEETDSFEALATIYEDALDAVEKGPAFIRMALDAAVVLDGKLDDPEGAEAIYRRVLEYDPACSEALENLADMYARRGRDGDYVESLRQKLEIAPSIEEKKHLLAQIAQAQETRLADVESASFALLRSLELEPDRESFRALVELFRRHKMPDRCIEILERARDFEVDPKDRAALQIEIAEIQERELSDDGAAIGSFRLALEYEPDNRSALNALERIFTRLDRAAELLEIYRILISLAEPAEAVHLQFKSAAIWQDKLRNLDRADACLRAVLELEPDNIQAVKNLEKIRRADAEARRPQTQRWEDLIQIYDYHLELEMTQAGQVALLVAKGGVCKDELGQREEAFAAFERAMTLDPICREAVHALADLHEEAGEFKEALAMLKREGELLGRTKEAAAVCCRMGTIHLEKLDDPTAARKDWNLALELNAASLPAICALQKLNEVEEDSDGYIDMVEREAVYAQEIDERIQAHLKAAKFYSEAREDDERASSHYEEALALDGKLSAAARPLSDICVAAQRWERSEQLLDIVVSDLSEKISDDSSLAGDLCRQLYRLGYVCEKLGKDDRALGAYERAYQLDSTYLPSAEGYANRLVATERFADAVSVYQAILIHHSEELTDLEIVDIYWQQGDLYRKLGQDDRAQREFERALSHDGQHDPSLRSMAEISEAQGRFDEALKYLERLSELVDGKEKFETLVRAGVIAKDKLNDPYRGIDALSLALEIEPTSLKVLDLLLSLYTGTQQSVRAVEVLEKIIELIDPKKEPARACRFLCALGEVCRDGLRDIPRAAKAFNAALDIDFRFVQAFGALEAMLGENRQWDLLEENYQRMLQRIPKRPETRDVRMVIFRALGAFYENVRRDLAATLQIYRMLAKGMPTNGEILEKYARLAAVSEGGEEEAKDAYRQVLPFASEPQKTVQAIARLSAKSHDYDGAYVAAQVAQYIFGDVSADEREILTKLSVYAQRHEQPRRPLTDDLWTRIYHPRIKGPMGQILAFIHNQLGDFFAHRHSAFGIDVRTHRVDQSGQEFALNTYRYIAQVCGMTDLPLYSPYLVTLRDRLRRGATAAKQFTHPDKDLFLEMVHVHPAALKAGGALFTETDPKRMTFQMVRETTFCRPEMVLARTLPAARLEALFQAAIYYTVPGYRPTADMSAIEAEGSILANLQSRPQFLSALSQLCQAYVRTASGDDLRTYVEAVELTADRAATLACSDIGVAVEMLKADQKSKLPLRSRTRDLLLFCMSQDYAILRRELGLAIEINLPPKK